MTTGDQLREHGMGGPVPPPKPRHQPLPIEPDQLGVQRNRRRPPLIDVVLISVLVAALVNYRERLQQAFSDLTAALGIPAPTPLELLIIILLVLVALRVKRHRGG